MWFTATAEGMQGWLVLKGSSGVIKTGEPSGSFTCTVVNPQDTASTVLTITESSTKPGLYKFLVPTSFFTTHGVGVYAVVIQVVTAAPIIRDVLSRPMRVSDFDFDTIGANTALIPALL